MMFFVSLSSGRVGFVSKECLDQWERSISSFPGNHNGYEASSAAAGLELARNAETLRAPQWKSLQVAVTSRWPITAVDQHIGIDGRDASA